MKKCSTCKSLKYLAEFGKDRSRSDGLRVYCKPCSKIHREKSTFDSRAWRDSRREKLGKYSRAYYAANKVKQLAAQKAFREANPEVIIARRQAHYAENRDKIQLACQAYAADNLDKIRQTKSLWSKRKMREDPVYALKMRYRARVRAAVRKGGFQKGSKTAGLLGCSWQELRSHLEAKFYGGMTWDDMHLWHIDHIMPLASAKTSEELARLCHYTNLQPLWASDNLSKGSAILGAGAIAPVEIAGTIAAPTERV